MTQRDHKIAGVGPAKQKHKPMSKKIVDLLLESHDKQSRKKKIDLDLREITLLDNQSTVDLFCNPDLVEKTRNSRSKMQLRSNGGGMRVKKKATKRGYKKEVWFSTQAATNTLSLANLTKQFRATYDSNDEEFVVHRDDEPNTVFRMHE